MIKDVVGIVKAYNKSWKGPFVTELFDETGERIRTQGRNLELLQEELEDVVGSMLL